MQCNVWPHPRLVFKPLLKYSEIEYGERGPLNLTTSFCDYKFIIAFVDTILVDFSRYDQIICLFELVEWWKTRLLFELSRLSGLIISVSSINISWKLSDENCSDLWVIKFIFNSDEDKIGKHNHHDRNSFSLKCKKYQNSFHWWV